jgi:hypothetical protein
LLFLLFLVPKTGQVRVLGSFSRDRSSPAPKVKTSQQFKFKDPSPRDQFNTTSSTVPIPESKPPVQHPYFPKTKIPTEIKTSKLPVEHLNAKILVTKPN